MRHIWPLQIVENKHRPDMSTLALELPVELMGTGSLHWNGERTWLFKSLKIDHHISHGIILQLRIYVPVNPSGRNNTQSLLLRHSSAASCKGAHLPMVVHNQLIAAADSLDHVLKMSQPIKDLYYLPWKTKVWFCRTKESPYRILEI